MRLLVTDFCGLMLAVGPGHKSRGGPEHTLVVVDDITKVVTSAVVCLAHTHRVVRQVDIAIVAEDCRKVSDGHLKKSRLGDKIRLTLGHHVLIVKHLRENRCGSKLSRTDLGRGWSAQAAANGKETYKEVRDPQGCRGRTCHADQKASVPGGDLSYRAFPWVLTLLATLHHR